MNVLIPPLLCAPVKLVTRPCAKGGFGCPHPIAYQECLFLQSSNTEKWHLDWTPRTAVHDLKDRKTALKNIKPLVFRNVFVFPTSKLAIM